MALRWLLVLGLAVLGVAQWGCSTKACTLIGCGVPFEVTFTTASGAWAAGTYDVSVTADGDTGTCTVTLPFASCQTSSTVCTGTRKWDATESGCALPADQHSIAGIVFRQATPANVHVVISRGGQPLADGTFTPVYKSSEPNGPGCGDTCYGAPGAMLSVQP
jgi:hypothetical protein